MADLFDDDVQDLIRRFVDTMTPEQRWAMILEGSSDDDDETLAELQHARELLSAQVGENEQDQVKAAEIETPEQALALSDMMRALQPQSELATVAAAGDSAAVALLLQNGHDANHKDGVGETALYLAAARGHSDIVSQLLDAGADPDIAEDIKSWSPLHAVCQIGNETMAKHLLRHGASPSIRDNKSWTPLHVACLYGNAGCVEALIESSADVDAEDSDGRKPIHVAVDFGQEAVIRLLVENGVALDCADSEGTTPLHLAATSRPFSPPVQLLLQLGAQVDPQDAHRVTPLLVAVMNKTSDPELMIPPLLRWRADVDLQDESGLSPAFAAIARYKTQERMRYCRLVLERSQMLNGITTIHDEPQTLLLYAIETRNILAVRLLLELGASLDLGVERMVERTGVQYLPVFAATVARDPEQPEILATLLQEGADPNSCFTFACTPLHICAAIGHNSCAQTLLDARADMNMLDANGSTPLQVAIQKGHSDVAKTLIAADADVNAGTNLMSGTPLHLALRNYEEEVLLALVRADADPTAKDYQMDTPLDMLRELVQKVLFHQQDELVASQNNVAEHNDALQEEDGNEEAIRDTALIADPALLPSYNRVLTLMLEKMADRDARKFGWPLMGEEGWYGAQLLSMVPAALEDHTRPGPKIRDVKNRYTMQSLKPFVG